MDPNCIVYSHILKNTANPLFPPFKPAQRASPPRPTPQGGPADVPQRRAITKNAFQRRTRRASRSGDDAESRHRGCFGEQGGTPTGKPYYRNDPEKYSLKKGRDRLGQVEEEQRN
ncbi:hypothetical protein niasHT_028577 [Heterodera trifolii]|uniref:Uncharacterized protein n=1 Tax=Heterodera trifolii TaxID=157864 RepID=A0ABD2JNZ5_9BILA